MTWSIGWMALGLAVISWPDIYSFVCKSREYSESEMLELSERYEGINRRMTIWTLCAGTCSGCLMLVSAYFFVLRGGGAVERVFPAFAGSISLNSLVFPVFARVWGAYPVPKSYRYLVEPRETVNSLIRSHVAVSVLALFACIAGVLWPT